MKEIEFIKKLIRMRRINARINANLKPDVMKYVDFFRQAHTGE